MHKKLIILSGVCLAGFVPAASFAQAAAGGGKQLNINVSAEVRHNSNIARTTAATAAQRGLSRSDEKFSPSLNVNLGLPFAAHNFSLSGGVGYDFHRRNTRLDRERIQLGSALALSLSPCTPSFNGQISRRQSDLGDSGGTTAIGANTVSNAETQWSLGGSVACGKSFGLRPTAGITYQDSSNSNPQRELTNKHITTYMLGMGYLHPSIGDIQLFAQQREVDYVKQLQPNGNRQRSYGVSFSRNIGARLQGSASISWSDVKSRQPGVRGYHGVNWSGDLTLKATPRLQVHTVLGRSISSTLAVAANYNVATNYGIDATYALTPRINFSTGYSHTKRKFQGSFDPLAINVLTNDRKQSIFGSIDYLFSPKLKFILSGGHDVRNANGTFYDYHNNQIGLRAELAL